MKSWGSIILLCLCLVSPGWSWAKIQVQGLKVLYTHPLEDVSFYVRAGNQPDAFLAFSPHGRLLAVGSFLGYLRVYEALSGRLIWQRHIPEGMIKRIAFSPSGRVIYYAEQSPDGYIYAANAQNGKLLWRFRLADDLQTGTPPPQGDVYGVYREPGCYRLQVLRNGDLLVLGIHSWYDQKARLWRRLSRVYRLSPQGKLRWAWPKNGPAPLTLIYAEADLQGQVVALVSTSPADDFPSGYPYPPGAFFLLDGQTGRVEWVYKIPPLKPYYDRVSVWESVRVSPDARLALVGTADGRALLFDLRAHRVKTLMLGAPLRIGGLPVAAMINYGLATRNRLYFVTGASSVPYALPLAVDRPAGPHPHAETLFALDFQGRIRWCFGVGFRFQGLATDYKGRWLAVAVGASRRGFHKRKQFGVFVFDTARPGGGLEKFWAYFPTQGPCFFHLAWAPQGNILAVVETPYLTQESRLRGRYRLWVLRMAKDGQGRD